MKDIEVVKMVAIEVEAVVVAIVAIVEAVEVVAAEAAVVNTSDTRITMTTVEDNKKIVTMTTTHLTSTISTRCPEVVVATREPAVVIDPLAIT
jgi:hypothetical protein